MQYKKYRIKETDSFEEFDFPKVQEELDVIQEASKNSSCHNKAEVILSYLKGDPLKKEWIDEDPGLTSLLTSDHFTTAHIEALLDSCQENRSFLKGFEDHIKQKLEAVS